MMTRDVIRDVLSVDTVVTEKSMLSSAVVGLTLRDATGCELPAWQPGSHIDVELPGGVIRQYSLCGDPADRFTWRIGVLREPEGRGGSKYIHDTLVAGATLRVRGLRNHFPLISSSRYLLIAGGIGITPMLPMVAELNESDAQWRLLYGGRTRESMAFLPELEEYGENVVIAAQDEVGLLDLQSWVAEPCERTRIYCCGPEPLLSAVEALTSGWPHDALQIERFHSVALGQSESNDSFEVELAVSGITLTIPPDKSVLEVLEEEGLGILSSCREGTCGTCETSVLEGIPDHRDSLLTKAERDSTTDFMYVCVSRSRSARLVLDL